VIVKRWQQIEQVCHDALAREPTQRAAFLDDACAGDADLRREVESLIAQQSAAEGFLEMPALQPGSRLDRYEVVVHVASGGMGEVYQARDTRLDRLVAIKVLPPGLAADPERRRRFEHEARAVASLNHPHICTLHDVGSHDGSTFLIMEYLDGETLAARLQRGALPLTAALEMAADIADALAAAHRIGVVHRDLKPANVMLTKGGVKLLDFGLAKLRPATDPSAAGAATAQPTTLTAEGTIPGTIPYMSPEQIEGREADARSDLFAFGAMLHEMISGAKAFEGKTKASLIAAILEREPAPLPQLRPETPLALARLVRTCLAKDPTQRWQSAVDLERALAGVLEDIGSLSMPHPTVTGRRRLQLRVAWGIAIMMTAAAVGSFLWRERRPAPSNEVPMRFSLGIPADLVERTRALEISPDGRHVAVIDGGMDFPNASRMWMYDVSDARTRLIEGAAGAQLPFWSPDSGSIAFFANGALKTVDLQSGSVRTLCDAPAGRGGSWGTDGTIVFAPDISGPLMRISAQGSSPSAVTWLDPAARDRSHRLPSFFADGRHFVFTKMRRNNEENVMAVGSLDSPVTTDIGRVPGAGGGGVVALDKVLYVREGMLMAQAFDTKRFVPYGAAVPIVRIGLAIGFSVSSTGVIVYNSGAPAVGQLAVFSRSGARVRTLGEQGSYYQLAVSPDGRNLAVGRVDPATDVGHVWVFDVKTGQGTPVTRGAEAFPSAWSADGRRVLYQREKTLWMDEINALEIDTGRDETLVKAGDDYKFAYAWLKDGSVLYGAEQDPGGAQQLWRAKPGTPDPELIATAIDPLEARVSSDGRLLAYTSSESGRPEIFVQGLPSGSRRQITSSGARQAEWRGDSKELYYLTDDGTKLSAVAIHMSSDFEIGAPTVLFQIPKNIAYAPAPDGGTFYVLTGQLAPTPMVLLNALRQ